VFLSSSVRDWLRDGTPEMQDELMRRANDLGPFAAEIRTETIDRQSSNSAYFEICAWSRRNTEVS
jgi:hypothetical protein